ARPEDNQMILLSIGEQIAHLPVELVDRVRRLAGRTAELVGSITELEIEKLREELCDVLVESLTTDLIGRIRKDIVAATVSLLIEHGVVRLEQDPILNQTMIAHLLAGRCYHC